MRLKEYLFFKNQTVTDMAKQLMVSRMHLSGIAAGRFKPSKRLARDIETYTDGKVTAEELLRDIDSKDSQKD